MLTPQLQKTLDAKWDNCWPVSDLRPFALLDLISYIFFIKKLDDWELIHQKVKSSEVDNFIYTREIEEFTWSKLQNLDAREIQLLFNKEHGVIDLMNNYACLNSLYSDYFKAPLLIEPTPKLIFNAIEIINIIETNDKINQGAIIEYLFNKLKTTDQNRQEFIPEFVSKLMVSIANPSAKDAILDPSAGNGSLLINTHQFIESHINYAVHGATNEYTEANLEGQESDLVLLRLAAMNMVLHGIKNPDIHIAHSKNESLKNNPALVISALLFSNNLPPTAENQTETNILEKENLLLTSILENLNNSGRAVILVPQILLKSDNPAIIKTRKNIVDHCNLEAVITLPSKNNSLFSEAGIMVFNKLQSETSEVWFCKWGTGKKKNRNNIAGNDNSGENENDEFTVANDILNKWNNRKEIKKDPSRNSFFISANYFKTNNYKLSFNDYKLIRQSLELNKKTENIIPAETETIIAAKKENLNEFFEESTPLPEKKQKRRSAPLVITLIILILGTGAFYWFYLKGNSNNYLTRDKITNSASKISVANNSKDPEPDTAEIKNSSSAKMAPSPVNNVKPDSTSEVSTKYTVVNKAWFHYEPDPSKLKPVYLPPRKDVILSPTEEENGFIYVVYINSRGEATHGWLNKKDLRPVE